MPNISRGGNVSGEEEWLDALEAGELDERGDLPAGNLVLTARQVWRIIISECLLIILHK